MEMNAKVCVVTGASSGIGRRTALDLAREGASVCVAARREERLRTLVEEMGGSPHSQVATDVAERHQVSRLAEHVRETYGRCDVLVNNAGFSGRGGFDGPPALAELHRVMATNFFGAAYCTAELLELLVSSAPSHVVNVASMAGRIATPGVSAYCASKFALVGWSESLQPELAAKGVFVSSIEPGFIPTEGFPQTELVNDRVMRHLLGSEEDVSGAIRDAIRGRKPQRVVPRWYYLFQVPRLLTPRVYRAVAGRVMASGTARAKTSGNDPDEGSL
jgi:short-subunit dehydrogenase